MKRILRRLLVGLGIGLGVIVGSIGLTLAGWHLLDGAPSVPEAIPAVNTFDATRLLVLADADMAATAYADGLLYPMEGEQDALIVLSDLTADNPTRIQAEASNTVMGWPGATTVSADGTLAYVTAGRGMVDDIEQVSSVREGMPITRTLTTIDLVTGDVLSEVDVCVEPMSVDIASTGTWLLIACRDIDNELTIVPLIDGLPGDVRAFDLEVSSPPQRPDATPGATYSVIHPSGQAAGVILNDTAVTLARFELDANGIPISVVAETPELYTDRWLSVARWTRSGNHLLVADVAWGPRPTDAVLNGNGAILSLALSPEDEARGLISEATVSKSPEAFEMNRTGDLLAVVNMERTYLPGGPLSLVPARGASSLSLVGVDDATGILTTYGEPVGFRGVLPEDAVFDADGDQIAVVIYQDHDAPRSNGWLSFFDVDRSGVEPTLTLTDRQIDLPRGAHDLAIVD
ncbi:MAG: hypothetical protein AAF267_16080 [Deinococcota bacterium]